MNYLSTPSRIRTPQSSGLYVAGGRLLLLAWAIPFAIGCEKEVTPKTVKPAASDAAGNEKSENRPTETNTGEPIAAGKQLQDQLAEVDLLLSQKKVDEAWQRIQNVLAAHPKDPQAMFFSARVLHARSRVDSAIKQLDLIEDNGQGARQMAQGQAADWLMEIGKWRLAEEKFLALSKDAPDVPVLNRRLSSLLSMQGRRWESSRYFYKLLLSGDFTFEELFLLLDLNEPIDRADDWKKALAADPAYLIPKIGEAQVLLYKQSPEKAEVLFREVLAAHPDSIEAWTGLGRSLAELEQVDQFENWLAAAPKNHETHPQYWVARGLFARLGTPSEESKAETVRCFMEAIKRDGGDLLATNRLAEALTSVGELELAEKYSQRARLLQDLQEMIQQLVRGSRDVETLVNINQTLEKLGRRLEANGWQAILQQLTKANSQQQNQLRDQRKAILAGISNVDAIRSAPVDSIDRWSLRKSSPLAPQSVESETQVAIAPIALIDVAASVGLDVRYDNGDDPKIVGMNLVQSNGGGVAVIDFDRDGWSDLFFSQAGGRPLDDASNLPCHLHQNRDGKTWANRSEASHSDIRLFGQGVNVGDFNQDGFDDLLVANFGVNRLLQNNGDGTFSDVTSATGITTSFWTSSCALADVDGDQLPDLIEINYCTGNDVLTRQCPGKDGIARVCRPTEFPPAPDFIFRNCGDGTFERIDEKWKVAISDGRGLGVVVGNFDQKQGNDIFVANDITANYLLVSESAAAEGMARYQLSEQAGLRGCAVDGRGKPQACMGIASGDVDRDGRFDLFVTNFYNEYNTLYLQLEDNLFTDATRRWKLVEPSLPMLGFGTQFADVDHDGWLDMVVLNGHIDDYSYIGIPYRMRPQLFRGLPRSFVEQPEGERSEFFTRPALGRALATLDWNRDGKQDFIATHLDQPAALLENRTNSGSHFVRLNLVGTVSERNAVGAVVTINAGNQKFLSQVTAGDGYQSSNEKSLDIGIGSLEKIDSILIHWPAGAVQELAGDSVMIDQSNLIVEARP